MPLQQIKTRQGRQAKKSSTTPERKHARKATVKSVPKEIIASKASRKGHIEEVISHGFLTEQGDLPKEYGAPRVVLMPVDHHLANVYWEIDAAELERIYSGLKKKFNRLRPALRLYDLGGHSFDIDVDLQSGNRYVRLPGPGKSYFADLGVRTESTIFFPIVRSNTVEIPFVGPQPEVQQPIFVSRKQAVRQAFFPPLCALPGDDSADDNLAAINEKRFSPGIFSSPVAYEQE